ACSCVTRPAKIPVPFTGRSVSCHYRRGQRDRTGLDTRLAGPPGRFLLTVELAERKAKDVVWARRHLLGLEELSRAQIETILHAAEGFIEVSQRRRKKRSDLKGKVVVNLFFEPSTRTRSSFSFAAKQLSADVFDFSSSGSSLSKGETFIDTAK